MIQATKIIGIGLIGGTNKATTGKKNFSIYTAVRTDNSRQGSVDTTSSSSPTPSSYNGPVPELLRDRADDLQAKAVNINLSNIRMEKVRELASILDRDPSSLTTEQRVSLERVKLRMVNFDNDKTFTDNLNREINANKEAISYLEAKSINKATLADSLEPVSSESGSDDNKSNRLSSNERLSSQPEDNLSPTQYIHELESTSPMEIIPDDD